MKLVFLEADVPLTKSFTLTKAKQVETSSYPSVLNFTSHEVQANTLNDFATALRKHAGQKHFRPSRHRRKSLRSSYSSRCRQPTSSFKFRSSG